MKLRDTSATLELTSSDVCRLLTEAICTPFGMFEHLAVYRVTRLDRGGFRLTMGDKPKPVAVAKDEAA
jgi:hypothetical protein